MKTRLKTIAIAFVVLLVSTGSFGQQSNSNGLHLKGSLSATNNGFSFIPSFTLGKPAAILNLSVSGDKRFSFEPEFRYALEGKPWSFIFIWRYKLIKTNKFQFTIGTHLPALNFRTVSVVKNADTLDVIQSTRYFPVLEASPFLSISKNIGIGVFYLYGHGMEKDVAQNIHYLSLRANFSRIPLFKKFYLRCIPQLFYLKSDDRDGYYTAANLTLARNDFPFSISTMLNKALDTDVPGKDFDWNISLVYSFDKKYVKG